MTNKRRGRVFREKRQDSARGRAEARALLTPADQIKALDAKLGVGVGAERERARLTSPKKSQKLASKKTAQK